MILQGPQGGGPPGTPGIVPSPAGLFATHSDKKAH